MPNHMLGELAAFVTSAVDAMGRECHKLVGFCMVELVPPRRFPDGMLLIAHGAVPEAGGLPFGLRVGLYRLEDDGRTLEQVAVAGQEQLLGMHKAGCAALAGLFAEAVAAATPPAGTA